MIEATAERWLGYTKSQKRIMIEKRPEGVFVDGRKPERVKFNHIQLRFEFPNDEVFIIFDKSSNSELPIREMYLQLTQ
jgi:hypothetical protein